MVASSAPLPYHIGTRTMMPVPSHRRTVTQTAMRILRRKR